MRRSACAARGTHARKPSILTQPRLHLAIVAPPLLGHVDPLIALGTALARLGHRLTLVHVPGAAQLVSGTAVEFSPIDWHDDDSVLPEYLRQLARADGPIGLPRMIRATVAMTERLLDRLPATLARIGADAVIADLTEPAGALAARRLGIPHVTTVTGLPLMRDPALPPAYVGWRYRTGGGARIRDWGGHLVAGRLMRPISRVAAEYRGRWRLAEDDTALIQVAQCPRLLDFPRAALAPEFHYGAPWRLPQPPRPRPSDDDRPLIFCSLGSLQGSRARLFAAMTSACARVGARAIVAHGGGLTPAEAAALPGDPLVRAWWPQRAILPYCAAAMLHGGFNTVLDALAAGVPIVALPIAFEQPGTAARIARAGAGVVVGAGRYRPATLARALAQVIAVPTYRTSARRMADAMDEGADGATRAAALIDAALMPATSRA